MDHLIKKTRYYHIRIKNAEKGTQKNNVIETRGGATICYFTKDDKAYLGVAICAKNDCYNKETGRYIAVENARKNEQSELMTRDQILEKGMKMIEEKIKKTAHFQNKRSKKVINNLDKDMLNDYNFYENMKKAIHS